MKVKDIIKRVRNAAGDQDAIQFDDNTVVDWINDGMRECASNNFLLQKKATQTLTAGTKSYVLPTDILKLHSITLNSEQLPVYTLEEAQERGLVNNNTGTPSACYVWAGSIELCPTPDNADTLVINYSRNPADVSGEQDTPDLPVSYHARLVDYCLAQVAQQDDDMNRYNLKMQEFRTGVQQLKDVPEWQNDLYPSISVGGHDFGNGYGDYYDVY